MTHYYWDFGDGQRAEGTDAKHSFQYPGTYELHLGVTSRVNDNKELPRKECATRRIVVVKPVK
jgi:PKD repeat protein